ncbi:hypothetical protein PR048_029961 [Dryococelus australis]|uniref:Reverse transcriptase domain-containing protein n=1 Tax=Dryococelus australis TaxID=614101 RepID=A0ABQ9G7M9_9NEOP|nr:hypothetical protein PR048_029961 [Dryococelus australis]
MALPGNTLENSVPHPEPFLPLFMLARLSILLMIKPNSLLHTSHPLFAHIFLLLDTLAVNLPISRSPQTLMHLSRIAYSPLTRRNFTMQKVCYSVATEAYTVAAPLSFLFQSMIHNQNQSCHTYRPIALLSVLSKVAERITLSRLTRNLEELNILPHTQFGFHNVHSALHAAGIAIDAIKQRFCTPKHSIFILLDLAKVFDSVHHAALLTKLRQFHLSERIISVIHSFLTWALLSPTLFSIFVADLPQIPFTQILQYANDTALLLTGKVAQILAVRTITSYLLCWRVTPNPKNLQLYFSPNGVGNLHHHKHSWNFPVRYLGFHLDSTLTWHTHITLSIAKAKSALCALRPLLSHVSPISQSVLIQLWQTLVLPILFYGFPVWVYIHPSSFHPVIVSFNEGLCLILGSPRYSPANPLYRLANTDHPMDIISRLANSLYRRAWRHHNPSIAAIADYDPADPHSHRRLLDFNTVPP